MNIYLINHTEVYNPNLLLYGKSEMPLIENFTIEFSKIKEHLNLDPIYTAFISSPLRRCTKLASFLSGDNFSTDDNFSELDYGLWEMEETENIDQTLLSAYKKTPELFKFPNGENLAEAKKRVLEGYKKALKSKKENLVIISHSSIIKLITATVIGLHIKNLPKLSADFGSIHKIEIDRAQRSQKLVLSNLVL